MRRYSEASKLFMWIVEAPSFDFLLDVAPCLVREGVQIPYVAQHSLGLYNIKSISAFLLLVKMEGDEVEIPTANSDFGRFV